MTQGGTFFLDYGPLNVDVVGSIDILSNIKFCTLMKIFLGRSDVFHDF